MTYKAIVIDYAPKAKKMAAAIEEKANEMAGAGWELLTLSVTNSAKAILVFRVPEAAAQEGGLQPDCDSITILRIDTAEDYSLIATKETYSADSPELAQIMDILSRCTYRRSFRTLAGANSTEGNRAGYWLRVYLDHGDDRVDFNCGSTGEILIDGLAWRIGYWGDRASLAMMQELSDILEQ